MHISYAKLVLKGIIHTFIFSFVGNCSAVYSSLGSRNSQLSSSDPSIQSTTPSHLFFNSMQCPELQVNLLG